MESETKDKKLTEKPPTGAWSEDRIEAKIDRDLRDSFPASDPPGWTLGVKRRDAVKEDASGPSTAGTSDATGK